MNMDGVVYRHVNGPLQPKAILNLASRRGNISAIVRNFLIWSSEKRGLFTYIDEKHRNKASALGHKPT